MERKVAKTTDPDWRGSSSPRGRVHPTSSKIRVALTVPTANPADSRRLSSLLFDMKIAHESRSIARSCLNLLPLICFPVPDSIRATGTTECSGSCGGRTILDVLFSALRL